MKRKGITFDTKRKIKANGWNLKIIAIKKMIRTNKNNNQKNENHIWYKNRMSNDEIQRQINSINDSRLNTSQLKEYRPNLI